MCRLALAASTFVLIVNAIDRSLLARLAGIIPTTLEPNC
jgi:hypothetical protein